MSTLRLRVLTRAAGKGESRQSRGRGPPGPGEFNKPEVAPARETAASANRAETARPENNVARPANAVHPNDLPPRQPFTPPNTGNAQRDQKYQQGQDRLIAKQNQERQQLQQRQEQDHQKQARQNADEAGKQRLEQQHQQQTQQLEQKHAQQQQKLQGKAQPPNQKHASTLR